MALSRQQVLGEGRVNLGALATSLMTGATRPTFLVVETCVEDCFDCARRHWTILDPLQVRLVVDHILVVEALGSTLRGELELLAVYVRAGFHFVFDINALYVPLHTPRSRFSNCLISETMREAMKVYRDLWQHTQMLVNLLLMQSKYSTRNAPVYSCPTPTMIIEISSNTYEQVSTSHEYSKHRHQVPGPVVRRTFAVKKFVVATAEHS